MDSLIQQFALDSKGVTLLSSIQGLLVLHDIDSTINTNKIFGNNELELKEKKKLWFDRWKKLVEQGFREFAVEEKPELILDANSPKLKECLEHVKNQPLRYPAALILLEVACFEAYYPFDKITDTSDLWFENDSYKERLRYISEILGFPPETAEKLKNQTLAEQQAISGYWNKVFLGAAIGLGVTVLTAGIAAPYIAGAIGAGMGLSGAAAISAGMAALGGGAIAAGGAGIAGGMAAIVGGGAILGLGLGVAGGHATTKFCVPTVLLSTAKLQVMLKEFILQGQQDIQKMQEVLKAQRDSILDLQCRIDQLILEKSKDEEELNNLKAIVEILETATLQSRNWMVSKDYGQAH